MLKTDVIQKAILLNPEAKMLLIRRCKTDTRRPLQWDLPGGFLDEGEDMVEGVKREIKEETGIDAKRIKAVYAKTERRKWKTGESNAVFVFFSAHTDTDSVELSHEHDKFVWVSIQKATDMIEYYLHKELLNYVVDNELEL